MRTVQIIYGIMKGDFLNRTKEDSFWVIIGMTAFITSLFIPPDGASYLTVALEDYRGLYNSAWVGTVAAMTVSWSLGLFGFYLVNHSIENDKATRVGQIIESTPVSRAAYLFGKHLSNIAILSIIVATSMAVSIMLQIIRGESFSVQLMDYIIPFSAITLPSVIFVSSLAILFQSVGFLNGVLGNLGYFLLFTVSLMEEAWMISLKNVTVVIGDLFASNITMEAIRTVAYQEISNYAGGSSYGFMFTANPGNTFLFSGIEWTSGIIIGRLLWVLAALLVVGVSSLVFKGFDPARSGVGRKTSSNKEKSEPKKADAFVVHNNPLPAGDVRKTSSAALLVRALLVEIKLSVKGISLWSYLIMATLFLVSLLAPLESGQKYLLPILWLWPITIWSQIGVRVISNHTMEVVLSSCMSVRSNTIVIWWAGFVLTMLTGSGVGIRLLINGNWTGSLTFLVGAMFIPTMALFLGVWTRTKRAFEVLYFLLWYLGPLNGIWFLDYMGATFSSMQHSVAYMGVVTLMFFVATVRRQHYFNTLFD